jgi:alkylation response protein AidB-like acyl-CoA dehydrogenase
MSFDINRRDIEFLLREFLDLNALTKLPKYSHVSTDDIASVLDAAEEIASSVIAPLNIPSDRIGARYDSATRTVTTSPGYKQAHARFAADAWGAANEPEEFGGMGLPQAINIALEEIFTGKCSAFSMAMGLTKAGANAIITLGSDEQKKRYVANMLSGKWTGTMCLTEPHAGTDVGDARAKAVPIEGREGIYKITGTKRFISFGEHDMTENIIHLVLARTPNSPAGTKGISLFIIPKYKLDASGSTTVHSNDVSCGGIEHKMGIHGSPTCTMNFGDAGECEGELLGKEHAGMDNMFLIMNEARLLVGLQAHAIGADSLRHAVAYAKERIQCADNRARGDRNAPKVQIVKHHDVRRMLTTMKAHVESIRALLFTTAYYLDMSKAAEDPADRKRYHGWVELLTPVCKAYASDIAHEVTLLGTQVAGGAGYCSDMPLEQNVRDVKICSIYEGTNGIQALDLVFRKLQMKGGRVFLGFIGEMRAKLYELEQYPELWPLARKVKSTMRSAGLALAMLMGKPILKKNYAGITTVLERFGVDFSGRREGDVALTNAVPLLEVFGIVLSAILLLREAATATDKLRSLSEKGDAEEIKFYRGKIATARFFVCHILPRANARIETIRSGDVSSMEDMF